MPWTAADAPTHNKKATTPKLKAAWAKAANNAMDEYDDEGKAIATANAVVDKMIAKGDRATTAGEAQAATEAGLEEIEEEKKGEGEEDETETENDEGRADNKPYGNVEYADPGYQADKKKRYPLDTVEHIKAAWNYIHKATNAAKYTATQVSNIKSKIVAAWKKKIDKAGPPAAQEEDDRQFDLGVDFLTRDASSGARIEVKPNSYDPKTRTAEVLISTGKRVRRQTWDGEFEEVLAMSPQAVRLGRLNRGAQFIDSHQWWRGLDSVLGAVVPGSARIEGGQLLATLKLSRSEKGERIAKDLTDGITVPVSVGYRTHREEIDKTTSPETRVAVDWEPFEVSYAPVPHDEAAAIRAVDSPRERSRTMTPEQQRAAELAAAAEAKKKREEEEAREREARARAEAEAAGDETRETRSNGTGTDDATKRIIEQATKAAQEYAAEMMGIGRQANFKQEEVETAIRDGVTLEDFRKRAIEKLSKAARERQTSAGNGSITPANDDPMSGMIDPISGRIVIGINRETHERAEAMIEALTVRILSSRRQPAIINSAQADWVTRMGRVDEVARSWKIIDGREQPKFERTRQYLGRGFAEIAAECLGYRGAIRTPHQGYEIIARAFQSTSDYPAIFANVLNKTLLARYQLAMPTYREIALERQFNDFRPHPQIRAGEFPMLEPVSETGEIRSGASADSKETVSVVAYGKQFPISRQMIVNDDLNAIDEILGSAGAMTLVFENKTFFTMFNSNSGAGPTLVTDTTAVFASGHGNLAGTAAEPGILSIGLGRAALRGMSSISGLLLNVEASIILTGPAHETRADQMTATIGAAFAGAVNPFAGKLRNVCDANITDNSWYLFAEPGSVPCFVYGFLAGATGPRVRTDEPFGVQGIKVSLEHDFGCGAIDYRGAYRNAGVAPTDIAYTMRTTS